MRIVSELPPNKSSVDIKVYPSVDNQAMPESLSVVQHLQRRC